MITVEQVRSESYAVGSPGFYSEYRIAVGEVVATIAGPGPDGMGWCPSCNTNQLAEALGVEAEYAKDPEYIYGLIKAARRAAKGHPNPSVGIWSSAVPSL